MFTGLIETLAIVKNIYSIDQGKRLEIETENISNTIDKGASIAINGCCLTVIETKKNYCAFDIVQETLNLTCLGMLHPGDKVNIERSLKLNSSLDGHFVQGHVDDIGYIVKKNYLQDNSIEISIKAPSSLIPYIVKKGSIAVDGISLTITQVDADIFSLAIIPHTAAITTLGFKDIDDSVNLEVDMLAKYVEKLLCNTHMHNRRRAHDPK